MRWGCTVLALVACDPMATMTVRFEVPPSSTATVNWVLRTEGDHHFLSGDVFSGPVSGTEVVASRSECCGLAFEYNHGSAWFIACVEQPGHDAELVCGQPGKPDVHRTPMSGTSCAAVEQQLASEWIDVDTCMPTPR